MQPVLRRSLDRSVLPLALGVAIAPAVVALPPLLLADRYDWVASMAYFFAASWLVATSVARRTRWSVVERMVFGSFVLVCSYLACAILVEVVHGAMTDRTFWSQVLNLGGLLSLLLALCACLLGGAVVTVLFGTWLLLPLYPWMLVRERAKTLPTEDASEAMLFVTGMGAVVESLILGAVRSQLAWLMGGTATVGLAALAWSIMSWKRSLRVVSSYPALEGEPLLGETRLALRLSGTDDPSVYDTVRGRQRSMTYRPEPGTRGVAVPGGAELRLRTVVRAWLSPIDSRRIQVLIVLNVLWFVVLTVLGVLYSFSQLFVRLR